MLAALDRYLKEHDYKYSIIRDREFHHSKLLLEGKVKCLRQQGKGKRPNAANALTTEEEEMLWSKLSFGNCSPRVLSQTMWWILTQHFGLRGRQKHHSRTSVFVWTTVALSASHLKKILQRHCSVLPKMFATGGQNCPVDVLKQYLSRRPQELRDKSPFYLAIIENPKTNVWYKKQRLGVNSIDNMMKGVIKNTPLETSKKKLTNHTAKEDSCEETPSSKRREAVDNPSDRPRK